MLSVAAPLALDAPTLFVVATCVTALLGMMLLFASVQDRVRALAWWGTAYLVGGFSIVIWAIESYISPPLPAGTANALLFIACGMVWTAARLFHGRPVLWGAMAAGATLWFLACMVPDFLHSATARIVLSSLIVSVYTFLTAAELWHERRKHLQRRWAAIVVPIMHGMVFLCPIPLAATVPTGGDIGSLASGWAAVFSLEVMLYVVGTAFIVLVLSKERTVRFHQDAASTDELTGVLNRRGFFAAARKMSAHETAKRAPCSVLVFDLDHFKKINDRFGHGTGDEALKLFAAIASASMRSSDVLGRYGGEEFVAILPGTIDEAVIAADRVRAAFQASAVTVGGQPLNATVSVGAASGEPGADVAVMLSAADVALYRAKENGRNRVERATGIIPASLQPIMGPVPDAVVGAPVLVR